MAAKGFNERETVRSNNGDRAQENDEGEEENALPAEEMQQLHELVGLLSPRWRQRVRFGSKIWLLPAPPAAKHVVVVLNGVATDDPIMIGIMNNREVVAAGERVSHKVGGCII